MRLLRARRRDGALCVIAEVFGYEVDEMVRRGLLPIERRCDRGEIASAIGKILEGWFSKRPQPFDTS
jgi:hypothetical protein